MFENITNKTKTVLIAVLCISIFANAFMVFMCARTYVVLNQSLSRKEIKYDILSFANMFVEQVLMAQGEVDFDTRLTLETSVRSLNDKEILSQWQKFTKSSDETASSEAKNLLHLLIRKSLNASD